MPHRVAPRGCHRRRARGPRQRLVQKWRSRDEVRGRDGECVGDEGAQLGARGRVGEDAARYEARAGCVLDADGLFKLSYEVYGICVCGQLRPLNLEDSE